MKRKDRRAARATGKAARKGWNKRVLPELLSPLPARLLVYVCRVSDHDRLPAYRARVCSPPGRWMDTREEWICQLKVTSDQRKRTERVRM